MQPCFLTAALGWLLAAASALTWFLVAGVVHLVAGHDFSSKLLPYCVGCTVVSKLAGLFGGWRRCCVNCFWGVVSAHVLSTQCFGAHCRVG